MPSGEAFQSLVTELSGLMEREGEYISHVTALYLLGQVNRLPASLTAVSPRRRRNRMLGTHPVVFVFHPADRLKPIQSASFGKTSLPVSTLEKTLIDLLGDLNHAPPLPELADLFVRLPYKPATLLQLARQTSDTVLKRACFLLSWAGRAELAELPFPAMKRTPVKLDPREQDGPLVWDGRFFLKFPAHLLDRELPSPPPDLEPESLRWIELRRFAPFRQAMRTDEWVPVRGDATRQAETWLDTFFADSFHRIAHRDIEELLFGHLDVPPREKTGRRFPVLLNRWLDAHPEVLHDREAEITAWVRPNLSAADNDRLEVALYYGYLFGLHDQVLESLAKNGYTLFNAGRFGLLHYLCSRYLAMERPLSHYIFVVAARTLARQGKFDEAIAILDRGKSEYENLENAEVECGELAYAAGNLFRLMNRTTAAMSELILAREFYLAAKDRRRLATADCSLGNMYFWRGLPKEARACYLSALSTMKELGLKDAQASILGNLGLVEYDCGRFRAAALFLGRAVALQKMLKNTWSESTAALSHGKTCLKLGLFSRAMKIFKDCYAMKVRQNHDSGIQETSGLLGWLCELMGKPAAAKAWWDHVPPPEAIKEPRARFVVNAVRAMTVLFRREFAAARDLYRETMESAIREDGTTLESGDCLHGIGVAQTYLKDPEAAETLRRARENLATNPFRHQILQIDLFGRLYFPATFSEVELPVVLQKLLESQGYDPFWAFYALPLQKTGLKEADAFLESHLRKTPPSMLQTLVTINPDLKEVIRHARDRDGRTPDVLTSITDGTTHAIQQQEYQNWRKKYPQGAFIFDGPAGVLSYEANVAYLKPGSIPHGILNQLFIAFPHPVDIDALYKAVWGTEFDPECDPGAFKSSLQRLQKILRSVTPSVRIRRRKTRSAVGGIGLTISCSWEAVL